jgi:hypothetical protein
MTIQKAKPEPVKNKSRQIEVVCKVGDDPELATARVFIGPILLNANTAAIFSQALFQELPPLASVIAALDESAKRVNSNDMKDVEATLISQATALNIMFGELSRRAAANMGEYLETSERYMRMALKAQNQCRMTLETLSNIKNPPVIYAKQANITSGPQQVNNHAHAGENKNQPNKVLEQGHEQRMDGGTQSQASGGNSELETMDAGHRA